MLSIFFFCKIRATFSAAAAAAAVGKVAEKGKSRKSGRSLMGTSYAFEAAAATAALASPKAAQTCWQVYKMKLYYTSHSGPYTHTHTHNTWAQPFWNVIELFLASFRATYAWVKDEPKNGGKEPRRLSGEFHTCHAHPKYHIF